MIDCLAILLISFVQLIAANNEAELFFAGDAMQHGPQIKSARQADGTYDYSPYFSLIADDIAKADYAVVNLECVLGGEPYSGYPSFSAPDAYALHLRDCGFDLLQTTNNHCLDKGDRGVRRTLDVLRANGIPRIGTYYDIADRDTIAPYIATVKGIKIAFIAYTYGTNTGGGRASVVDRIDRALMAADIAKAKKMGAEVICALMHWGIEYQKLPSKQQRADAQFLIDNGVDLIIGAHPHVVQPSEMVTDKNGKKHLVVYSLGNFISNQNDVDSRGGSVVKVRLRRGAGGIEIADARYKLVFVDKPSPTANYYQLIPCKEPEKVSAGQRLTFDTFTRNVRALLEKHNIDVPEE